MAQPNLNEVWTLISKGSRRFSVEGWAQTQQVIQKNGFRSSEDFWNYILEILIDLASRGNHEIEKSVTEENLCIKLDNIRIKLNLKAENNGNVCYCKAFFTDIQ